ncbi:hypothetical protein C8R48DRAFT_741240 [Suillus tomentosus]|nr:hypothetical protein C8R48DRAFT_741240 [Suillus tomentosus]
MNGTFLLGMSIPFCHLNSSYAMLISSDVFGPFFLSQSNWLFKDLFHLWRCLIPWGERFYLVLVFRATCDFSGAHLDDLGTCPTLRLLPAIISY